MFLGTELETLFDAIARGETATRHEREDLAFGTPVLPQLSKHTGDRNRTSPMAFTGNKFEFRMLGSAQTAGLVNTVLNTIVADALDRLGRDLRQALASGSSLDDAVRDVVGAAYRRHGRVVFGGDGYSAAWEEEAADRGLLNLRTTPDALPHLVTEATIRVFAERSVLSARELHARYDVLVEQYATQLNIEGHTAARIARTQILPAILRHRELILNAGGPLTEPLLAELDAPLAELHAAIEALDRTLAAGPVDGLEHAIHMRDAVVPAMRRVRELADGFEHLVADDLWPLPAYAEMLFIR